MPLPARFAGERQAFRTAGRAQFRALRPEPETAVREAPGAWSETDRRRARKEGPARVLIARAPPAPPPRADGPGTP